VDPRVIHHGAGGVDHALYIDGTLPRVELAGGALLSVTGGNVGGVLGLVGDGCRMEVSSSAIYGGEAGDTGVLRLTGSGNATIASHASDRLGVVSIEGHARLSTRRSIAGGTITGGGSISLLGDATISNAGVDATLTMHGARSRLFVRTDAGITIDLLYGWGGSIDMDGMGGDLTISGGIINRSAFRLPATHAAGSASFAGVDVGDESMLRGITL